MPAVGDQHRGRPASIIMPNGDTMSGNPFEERPRRISEYTAQEIATLQVRLDRKLGPEYLSSRPGAAGTKVHYIPADKCINLANEVFGFNGWSSSITSTAIDYVDENPQTGKVNLGMAVVVRVTLRDGTFHEDVGYGHIENCKGKAAAFEKARKEGTTDGLKRALRTFGNVLGNCIYDKEYINKVTKIKVIPAKLDVDELHRHRDYAPIKKDHIKQAPTPEDDDLPPRPAATGTRDMSVSNTTNEYDGEFGSDLFDETDFNVGNDGNPDEIVVESDTQKVQQPPTPLGAQTVPQRQFNSNSCAPPHHNPGIVTPSKPERPINHAQGARQVSVPPASHARQIPSIPQGQYGNRGRTVPPQDAQRNVQNGVILPPVQQKANSNVTTAAANPQFPVKREFNSNTVTSKAPDMPPPGTPSAGFFSARAVDMLRDNPHNASTVAPAFDPHAESPSIRKTAGVDHTKSVPISKPMLAGVSPAANHTRDFINPSSDMHRKIGAPGSNGIGSPMNRGPTTSTYRPLTRPTPDPKAAAANGPVTARGGFGPPNLNGKRPPLNDVTNASASGGSGPAPTVGVDDPKRMKFDGAVPQQQQQQQQPPLPPQH